MKFKETETLPDHTLDIQPITYKQVVSDGFSPTGQSIQELTGGRILGVDYSNQGLSEHSPEYRQRRRAAAVASVR
jgi:hypothetical protein